MERVATVTSSYYKFSEAAILVYSVDNPDSFNSLANHLLEVASFAENAKIFLCGNKIDIITSDLVSNDDVDNFWYEIFLLNNKTIYHDYDIDLQKSFNLITKSQ